MRQTYVLTLAAVVLMYAPVAAFGQTTSPRLAIMDFSAPSPPTDRGYGDSSRRFWGDPGRMMSDLLTTHLAKSGRFEVVERARLYQLLNEKQISVGAAALGEQAKAIGSELGVTAIVVGGYAPSAYGYEVTVRVVSVADGSIMTTENALIPADPAWMDQSMAILAGKLSAPWSKDRGYVLDVFLEPDRLPLLMVDVGSAQGAKVGRMLEVSTAGDPIIHPVTHENLGTRDVLLATAAIIQTQKEFSYARVIDRAGVTSGSVKADGEGIDIGIERMQRVKLLDETTEVTPESDLSVLSVMKYVQITSDIPDAKLLVDGKTTPLNNNNASVRLGAGTHLVELQVGQMLLSREVTVTKQAVRPKEVTFRKADLASAVATKPPDTTPPAQGTTVIARTTPELTSEDRKADEKLLAMLPNPEVIDEQLRASRDEAVVSNFEAGLRALRFGYARGLRSYLTVAATRFAEVTRLAPELALGHFNLGLAKFYLDYLEDARAAFDQAVKVDKSLEDDVPLLWWEDFAAAPPDERLGPAASEWRAEVLPPGILRYTGATEMKGLVVALYDPASRRHYDDIVTSVRFRVDSPRAGILLYGLRYEADGGRFTGEYMQVADGEFCFRLGDGTVVARSASLPRLGHEWHVAAVTVHDGTLEGWLDGTRMLTMHLARAGGCRGAIAPYGVGQVDVDWALVTRY